MTSTALAHIVNAQIGYALNSWIKIEDIKLIVMGQDSVLYINPDECRYYFNTIDEILEISHGSIINNIYTSIHSEIEGVTPFTADSYVSFSELKGIVTSVFFGPYGTNYQRPFTNTF